MITSDRLLDFVNSLCAEEVCDEEEGCWYFRGGGECGRCTQGAMRIALEFSGKVLGYRIDRNPTAQVGSDGYDGHDFALLGERYIVDYWAWRVHGQIEVPVLDLNDPGDREEAKRLYGDPACWEEVHFDRTDLAAHPVEVL